jgi:acyl-CoA synthetase (AMP-forming)/AMP-acid ligase II
VINVFVTVSATFAETASRCGQRPFVAVLPETAALYGIDSGEISYATAKRQIDELTKAYQAAGYGHGHRVGLLLDNRPAFFLHWFALNAIGASVVPISADLRSAELSYLIGHSEIALAVSPGERHAQLLAAAATAGRELAVMTDQGQVPAAIFSAPEIDRTPDELSECALLYTSGTTGRPKGCVLQNRYFLHAGRWYASIGGMATLRPGQERMLTPLPLVHMNAMAYSAMAMVMTGGCLIVLDRFHTSSWWSSVRESRATVVHYLGVMPSMLMKVAATENDRHHFVRFGFGAGVDKSLQASFEERFNFPLLEAWAMTETGAGAVIIANDRPRSVGTNCFGREGSDVEVRLLADDGSDAILGEPAELLVRHAGLDPRYGFFSHYLKDPEATDEAWASGWFHTGDIVKRDQEGFLHFIDRRKNVIRRSGENISAVEVESILNQIPEVKAVAVTGTPDDLRGDEVLACIVTHGTLDFKHRTELAERIVKFTLSQLAYFKAPGYVAFVDSLPLTTSQKIQRAELKTMGQVLPGQANCFDMRSLKKRSS